MPPKNKKEAEDTFVIVLVILIATIIIFNLVGYHNFTQWVYMVQVQLGCFIIYMCGEVRWAVLHIQQLEEAASRRDGVVQS